MRIEEKLINRIKEIQLGMLREVDGFCKQNDIKYCLAYGTLLGAVRHDGYIPWDDDIDIWMPRPDYERFLRIFTSKDNKVCNMANTLNYPFYMAKIINTKTQLVEEGAEHINFDYGVYIDIFVLDVLPKNKIVQEIKLARNYILYSKLRIKYLSTNNKLLKCIQKKINTEKIYNKQKKLWENVKGKQYKDDTTLYLLNINKQNRNIKFNINLFNMLMNKSFENIQCLIPVEYDKILTILYGDYMQLPSENERIVHEFVYFKEK